jgi:hypothetical protein
MVRIFAEFFYHSHASLKQLHDKALLDLRQRVLDVASKWQQKIQTIPYEELHDTEFLDRVMRSTEYFADQLREILDKPIELSGKVETNNKQASHRLSNTLSDLKQAWLSRRYLLVKLAETGFSVDNYLHEKQMSMLDALSEGDVKSKRQRKPKAPKAPKEVKPKTWEVSLQLYLEGMKPDLIAKTRSLTLGTVIGHLTRYVDSGKVSFDDLVPADHQQAIQRVISKIGVTEGSTAIKNLCPPDITYDEIRLVMQRMQNNIEK